MGISDYFDCNIYKLYLRELIYLTAFLVSVLFISDISGRFYHLCSGMPLLELKNIWR